uniref:Integrase core domain containing protein n=1 Tax=Solanum tuberosum TaxID=4113 RepID=M1DNE8_SOLTU
MNIASRFWFGFISSTMMPSQNESILRHSKADQSGTADVRRDGHESQQKLTSLPFPVLVTELCRQAGVPHNTTRDVDVTPSSSTDIYHIEAEFTRDEVDRSRVAPTYTSPEVNVDSLPAEASSPTPASESSGIPAPSSSSSQAPGASSSSQLARITHAMILKMGQLAYLADVRATQLERSYPRMIDSAILAAPTPLEPLLMIWLPESLFVRSDRGRHPEFRL